MASSSVFLHTPSAVLRFSGEDHAEFLQNQGTADLRGAPGLCRHSLWLDHRGRIQGDGFVLKPDEQSMLLVSYATPSALLKEKFERHIIADDVEIEDLTGNFSILSVTGEEIGRFLVGTALQHPDPGSFAAGGDVRCFAGRRLGPDSLDFLLPQEHPLAGEVTSMTRMEAEALRIAGAVALVPVDTGSGDTALNPVEAGLTAAVSFEKGCYLGQEVVARAHRLDRASRRLVRFKLPREYESLPGALTDQETLVGAVTSVAEIPDSVIAIGWLKSRYDFGPHGFDGLEVVVESLVADS
jgi:folate-binding protein YgfZ